MTVGSLYTLEAGIIFSLALSVLAAFGMQNALDLTLFYVLTSFTGILVLYRGRRVASFLTSGLLAGAVGGMVILAYRLPDNLTDWIGWPPWSGLDAERAALTSIPAAAVPVRPGSGPDHRPAAAGSFPSRPSPAAVHAAECARHLPARLQVANLAEQGAKAIGADVLLTGLGPFTDAGKALNASFSWKTRCREY